jgi:uncharacterized protein
MAEIQHRPGRFELKVDGADGAVCELDYQRVDGRVVFTHTGVPAALQGRGLAAVLVEAGLAWARREGHKVTPACSYVARYIERHPGWSDLL